MLTPQSMTDPTETARRIAEVYKNIKGSKPILASWMGGEGVMEGKAILDKAGIPTYDYREWVVLLQLAHVICSSLTPLFSRS